MSSVYNPLFSCETHFNSVTFHSDRPGNTRSARRKSERPVHFGPVEDGDGRDGVRACDRGDSDQSGAPSESCARWFLHRDGTQTLDNLLRESGGEVRREQ